MPHWSRVWLALVITASPSSGATHNDVGLTMKPYLPSSRRSVRDQVALYEKTDGAKGNEYNGYVCVIVAHRGRRTGAERKTPVIRVTHDGKHILVGSYGGRPHHPEWVLNLQNHPQITLRDRATIMRCSARQVTDLEERRRVWESAVRAYPPYAEYQQRTTRQFALFVCEPIGNQEIGCASSPRFVC